MHISKKCYDVKHLACFFYVTPNISEIFNSALVNLMYLMINKNNENLQKNPSRIFEFQQQDNSCKFLPSPQMTDQTIRVKALQDKVAPQKIVVKSRDSFLQNKTHFF